MDVEILLEHSDWLRGLARSLVADPAEADDVIQDTFVAALEQRARGVRGEVENPRSWLRTVVRNFVHGRHRSRTRSKERERQVAVLESQSDPELGVDRLEMIQRLTALVLALEPAQREVIVLRYFDGLNSSEIAERLGTSAGAVRMRLKRTIEDLRRALDQEHDGDRGTWIAALGPILRGSGAAAATGLAIARAIAVGFALLCAGSTGSPEGAPWDGPTVGWIDGRPRVDRPIGFEPGDDAEIRTAEREDLERALYAYRIDDLLNPA